LPAAASRAAAGLARRARVVAADGRGRVWMVGLAAARRGAARGAVLGLLAALGIAALLAPADGATAGPAATVARQPIVEGVSWPEISLPVIVDLGELPEEWLDPVRAALATWNGANATFWFVEGSTSATLNGVRIQPTGRIMLCGGQFNPAACTY